MSIKPFTNLCQLLLVGLFLLAGYETTAQSFTENQTRAVIRQMENTRLQAGDFQDIRISSQYQDEDTGITHVYVQQQYRGIPIIGGTMGLHFDAAGELVYSTNHFLTNIEAKAGETQAAISAQEALTAALTQVGLAVGDINLKETRSEREYVFDRGEYSVYDIPVSQVFHTDKKGDLVLAWEVRIYPLDEQNYWVMAMDARQGLEIDRVDLVVHCRFDRPEHTHSLECAAEVAHEMEAPASVPAGMNMLEELTPPAANFYRVYDAPVEAPNFGERTMVGTAGDPNSSPLGWHDDGLLEYNITKGNNVYAYQDPGPLSTGIPAIGGLPGQQPLVFDFDANLSLPPIAFRDAAITNLFYWNNLIHDVFYQYGFTEAAGNFQWNNFANGGEGLDAVLAEAQDGSGVDNANFLTLADGLPGRMQMFLWTTGVPQIIDGDFDNGVIAHEYGHGISTRLTGGPAATCLSGDEQGGEGWSDYFGLLMTMHEGNVESGFTTGRGIGTYVVNEPTNGDGIRPARYSTDFGVNDYTYGDINNSEISAPHGVGFIWCTMMWEMTAKFVDVYGFDPDITYGTGGNNMALELIVTALKLQPCSPTFVEQRDAILAADQLLHGGTHQCLIWEAFAKRGLGFSANSGTNARGDETEAFDMPPAFCQPTVTVESETQGLAADGSTLNVEIRVTNNSDQVISGVKVIDHMPAGTSYQSASYNNHRSGNLVKFKSLSIQPNSTKTINLTLNVDTGSEAEMVSSDDLEANPFGWTASPGLDQFVWSNDDAFSGDYAWFCPNPNNFSNMTLTWNETINVTPGAHLRFAHRYNTEANFDGGRLEGSNDGGLTWTDLGPLFDQNGYSNFVALADNPLINGFCFGGNSGGWIHSLVDLSPYAGQSLDVRFRFASDVLTAAEGWYIDDMQLVTDPHLIYNTVSYSMANGFVNGSSTDEVLVLAEGTQALNMMNPLDGELIQEQVTRTGELAMELAPNPAHELVNIRMSLLAEGPVQLRIMNAQGKMVYQVSEQAASLDHMKAVAVADWPAGIYFIHVLQGEEQLTQKLIIK